MYKITDFANEEKERTTENEKCDNHFRQVNSHVTDTLGEEFKYGTEELKNLLESENAVEETLSLSRRIAQAYAPFVWQALLKLALGGNTPAIKLYFDIFGKNLGDKCAKNGENPSVSTGLDSSIIEISSLRSELFGEKNHNPAFDFQEEGDENSE